MTTTVILAFVPGVRLIEETSQPIVLELPTRANARLTLKGIGTGMVAALHRLVEGGATRQTLNDTIAEQDGFAGVLRFGQHLTRFTNLGLISSSIYVDDEAIATLLPMAALSNPPTYDPAQAYQLSRFCFIHRQGTQIILETPLAPAKLILHDWRGAATVGALGAGHCLEELCRTVPVLPADGLRALCELLVWLRALTPLDEQGVSDEDAQPGLQQWEFQDLLFHTRTRAGRHDNRLPGGMFPFLGKVEPLPALPASVSDEQIPLYRPDIAQLKAHDVPFTRVMEERKSIRDFGESPITAAQLGEFLYRSARVRKIVEMQVITPTGHGTMQASNRVYPGAGAMYELNLYLSITQCAGIEAGFYYYCPKHHELQKVSPLTESVGALLWMAQNTFNVEPGTPLPQVLITFASRFQRMSWKYPMMAYSLTLKNVGVLQQTMYLVAEAMGLAACAVGGGDSDLFAQSRGIDYYEETSVGEFVVGSRRQPTQTQEIPSKYVNEIWAEQQP